MVKIVKNVADLRIKSEAVTSVDEAKGILSELEDTLGSLDNGIGLAAIQIGKPKKIGAIKNPKGGYIHLINPEIVDASDPIVFLNEGCLSFPNVFRDTNRFKQIIIKNQVIRDDKFEDEVLSFYYSPDADEPGNDGLVCIAVQHEMDHFAGGLIIDYSVAIEPIVRVKPKIGRNDPCPCGSGKKYKKCCYK